MAKNVATEATEPRRNLVSEHKDQGGTDNRIKTSVKVEGKNRLTRMISTISN